MIMNTTNGRVVIELFPGLAPAHVSQMRQIAREGGWNGSDFHRVVPGFVVQGGASTQRFPKLDLEAVRTVDNIYTMASYLRDSDGYLDGMTIGYEKDEGVGLWNGTIWAKHCPGTVFAARTADPNSAETQFYINIRSYKHLDEKYTGWGRVVSGMDRVRSLEIGEPPEKPDKIESVEIASDRAEIDQPIVFVQRTDGPDFQRSLLHSDGLDVCEIPAVSVRIAN